MRILILLTALLLSPSLFAQVTVRVKPNRKQYVAYEPIKLSVTIQNQTGRPLSLRNTKSNNWIEFVVRNHNGRIVNAVEQTSYASTTVDTAESIKSDFILNNSYSLDQPGNYSVYAIVRTPGQTANQGSRSTASHFTVNRGIISWRAKIGVPGAAGSEREYRILTTNSGGGNAPQLYLQLEDIKKGQILATYTMGRFIRFRKPIKSLDRANNLHVLFLTTPELYCYTIVNTSGKTIKRDYYKSYGNKRPGLVTQYDGSIFVSNAAVYDPEQEKAENNKFHNLSELPGSFEQ